MKQWTSQTAIAWLNRTSDVGFEGNRILVNKGRLSGLTACSAFDFLVGHCGYKAIFTNK